LVTFDSILFNAAIIILPICLFEIIGNGYGVERIDRQRAVRGRWFIAATNSLTALFCVTHPIRLLEDSFDLRLLPFLISFIYGNQTSGFAVACTILIWQYAAEPSNFAFAAVSFGMLTPICMLVSCHAAPLFGTRFTYPLLLTCICLGTLYGLNCFFTLFDAAPPQPLEWFHFLFYNVFHLALIWLVALLLEHIRANAVMRQKLVRSEKLSVLSELAAAVAHEIRNPMTVARGFMQLLSRSEVDEEKKRTYTSMVIEEIDRAEKIITDYLSFAKPQALHVKPIDLRDAVRKAIQVIAPYAAARGVEVRCEMNHAAMPLLADLDRLVQGVVNICKHGIDAMPAGGMLRLRLMPQANNIVLTVEDEGEGMTEEEISRLGTPFYAMDTEGTGLSMMVAYRIVESLQGQVEVHSIPSKGTTFTISLPRLRP
jgi:two-component system sporulation sensor kinase B